jgi:hypothetical protein
LLGGRWDLDTFAQNPIEEGMLKKKIVFLSCARDDFPCDSERKLQQRVLRVFFADFPMGFHGLFWLALQATCAKAWCNFTKKNIFFSQDFSWTFDVPNWPSAHSQDGYHGQASSVGNPTTAREIPLLRPRES